MKDAAADQFVSEATGPVQVASTLHEHVRKTLG